MTKINDLIKSEKNRQEETLMMIPSENYTYPEVRSAVGSVLMHKYSEGYPGRRYYQGNKIIDEIEIEAIEFAKKLFKVPHANVQSYSGSPANSAILFALASNGNPTIMGMDLASGGHLTHGHPKITFSGRFFRSVQFGIEENGKIDYDVVRKLVVKERPKVLLIGTTAYPLAFNWKRFSEIAELVDAYLVADISHISGLIVAGVYPNPIPYAHVVMTTTHKLLRGPRGAIILTTNKGLKKDSKLAEKIDKAVFPGLQGGPHNNTTAGIAITLRQAQDTSFEKYGKQVLKNARTLATELKKGGVTLVGGGTDSHLLLIDLLPYKLSGNIVAEALEVAGIIVNRNSIPNDPMPPFYPSGIRLGTPAITTRGMKEAQMKQIAVWVLEVIHHVKNEKLPKDAKKKSEYLNEYKKRLANDSFLRDISTQVKSLCNKFPILR